MTPSAFCHVTLPDEPVAVVSSSVCACPPVAPSWSSLYMSAPHCSHFGKSRLKYSSQPSIRACHKSCPRFVNLSTTLLLISDMAFSNSAATSSGIPPHVSGSKSPVNSCVSSSTPETTSFGARDISSVASFVIISGALPMSTGSAWMSPSASPDRSVKPASIILSTLSRSVSQILSTASTVEGMSSGRFSDMPFASVLTISTALSISSGAFSINDAITKSRTLVTIDNSSGAFCMIDSPSVLIRLLPISEISGVKLSNCSIMDSMPFAISSLPCS